MTIARQLSLSLAVLLALSLCGTTHAQDTLMDRIQSGLDGVARSLDYVGRKAGELVGRPPGLRGAEGAEFTDQRSFVDRFPVSRAPIVAVNNEFGAVRVRGWAERVVEVQAQIVVGAESADIAEEIGRSITIQVTPSDDRVDIRTVLPDTRSDMGQVTISVSYDIVVPRGASVMSNNFFGDTQVSEVAGLVAIESQYGDVSLSDLPGPVKVRSHGEFAVRASGLRSGGVFQLNGARAEFSDIAGELQVSNFRGEVVLRGLSQEVTADVTCDSGSILLQLPAESAPNLNATVLFGKLESALPLQRSVQGELIVARSPNVETRQNITLSTSFGDVIIERESLATEPPLVITGDARPYNEVLNFASAVPATGELRIDAGAPGDIHLVPGAGDALQVTATRIVWVDRASRAAGLIEQIPVTVEQNEGVTVVRTGVAEGLSTATPGIRHRVDLRILVPSVARVSATAADGLTTIEGIAGVVSVEQRAGSIALLQGAGEATLTSGRGDISVKGHQGPVHIDARYGTVRLDAALGPISVANVQGVTILENVPGPVTTRNEGGDVRILALAGITGDYDIRADGGNIQMLLPPNPSVNISALAENGVVRTRGVTLSGTLGPDGQNFQGLLNGGEQRVGLHTTGGDISIDAS